MVKTVADLRALVGSLDGSTLREYWPSSAFLPGLPKGRITQICGAGKMEFIIRFLREHPALKAAWIEPDLSIYPTAILQRAVSLNRILFIEAGRDFPWAVSQALKSGLFEIVILAALIKELKLLRRFQLDAEKAHASLILISEVFSEAWPVALQLKSSRIDKGRIHIEVIRNR